VSGKSSNRTGTLQKIKVCILHDFFSLFFHEFVVKFASSLFLEM
jgi:hypothetical protein